MMRCPRGYTLLEIALVLAVLGILLGGALTVFTQVSDAQKAEETQEKLAQIDQALKRFFAVNRYLPCPGDATLADDDAVGAEVFGDTDPTAAVVMGCLPPQGGLEPIGALPVLTLGLPPEFMYDAWGRRISYQLTPTLRSPDSWLNESVQGNIQVVRLDGKVLTDSTGGAAYVLISHGRNGYYAYMRDGSQIPVPGGYSGLEADNGSGLDSRFTYADKTADFDDLLLFRAKGDIYITKRLARVVEPRTVTCTNARSIVSVTRNQWLALFNATYQTHANRIYSIALKMDKYCSKSTLVTPVHCPRNTLYLGPCLATEVTGGTCTTMSYSDGVTYSISGSTSADMDRRAAADCQCPGYINPAVSAFPKFVDTSFNNHYFGACLP